MKGNNRATVQRRDGVIEHYLGASFYVIRHSWIGRVEILAEGVELVGLYFFPLATAIGLATQEQLDMVAVERLKSAGLSSPTPTEKEKS